MTTRRLGELPGVAEYEPVSAIKIGRPSLSGHVVLIVEDLLAEDRRPVNAESSGTKTILS
jgi:hypothetical protein